MRYPWILFDADGTLFDYDHAEDAALAALWAEQRLEPRADLLETYRRINSALWRRFEAGEVSSDQIKEERFSRLVGELDIEADAGALSDGYLEHLSRQTRLLPGAERLLERLAPTRRLAMITNGLAQVQRPRLERSPIGRHFEVVVISEEVGFAKPDARIFDRALALMGEPRRHDVLMVGDNPRADIEGAERSGLATCWVNLGRRAADGGPRPTFEIHELDQLLHLLEE